MTVWIFCIALLVSPIAVGAPLQTFRAHYDVFAFGLRVGSGSIELLSLSNKRYRLQAKIRPAGAAALVVADRLEEVSEGLFGSDGPQPLRYLHRQSGGKTTRITKLEFDRTSKQIRGFHKEDQVNENVLLPLHPRTVDPLSLYLLAIWDLKTGVRADTYTLVSKTRLKTYRVRYHDNELLQTPLGEFATVRISQSRPGKDRTTTFWFAPALNYKPVQIKQTKKGSERLHLLIRALE